MRSTLCLALLVGASTLGCGARTPIREPGDGAAADAPFDPDVPVVDDVPFFKDLPVVGDVPFVTDVPVVEDVPFFKDLPVVTDVTPRCPTPLTMCGGRCVNTQNDPLNCGACGRACGDSVCAASACRATTCAAPTTLCGVRCIDLTSDAANCGGCGRACPAGQRCARGACDSVTLSGTAFRVASFDGTGCLAVEHNDVTGDDRGGIAVSASRVFYTGDDATGAFDLDMLAGTPTGRQYDALTSNLRDGQVYSLVGDGGPLTMAGGTVTGLAEIGGASGQLTGVVRPLSTPVTVARGGNGVGIFAGYDRVALYDNGRVYNIDLPSGRVSDLGVIPRISFQACESWGFWGVAEFFDGALHLTYVQDATTIARTRVPDGTTAAAARFTGLSDMCSITVSPGRRRWYWHHEGRSQFRSGDESLGYCDASFAGASAAGYVTGEPPRDATWVDACTAPGRLSVLPGVDDAAAPVELPFAFPYWGAPLRAGAPVNVTSNGWLGLDGVSNNALGGMIPAASAPNAVLAPHWGDNFTRAQGVCVATVGAAPSRRWAVEWADAHYCCTDDPAVHLTFEAVLNEGSGAIDFLYQDMRGERPQTTGIESPDGVRGVSVCTAGVPCGVSTGTRIRFTPTP